MCRRVFLLLSMVAALSLLCTSYASATITYVDATDGEAGNTTLATGEVFTPVDVGTGGSGADGLWRVRAFANSGTIYESGGSWEADLNTEDCPRLMTSVDVPEGEYDVYVYFWADSAQWRIQASLDNSEGDLPLYLANDPNSEATVADGNDFAEPIPMLTEDNRTLWQAYLGTTETTTITVYTDDDPNHLTGNSRTWYDGIGYEVAPEPEPITQPFTVGATGDITICNDERYGPDQSNSGSGVESRNIPARRNVALISYDISGLKAGGGVFSNVSFSHFSHDQNDEVSVYGIIEDLDLLDVESLTWNTAPGVQNDPTPELGAPVALDVNDLTDVLMTFIPPADVGVRFSTDTSQALADFLNSDTDGIVTFLFAASAEDTQAIIRSREHSAGGTLLEGEIIIPPEPVDPGTDGLIAYYAMEDSVSDGSGHRLHGTILGDPNFVAGHDGLALDLDGNGDYVDCGYDPLFDVTTNEITVSAWVTIRSIANQWAAIAAKGEYAWRLGNASWDPRFHFGITIWSAPDTASLDGVTAVGYDEWHHAAGVFDGSNIMVYLDGALDVSAATTEPIGVNDKNMLIGDNPDSPGRYWDGLIDELMIYNRGLSEGEVRYLTGFRTYTYDGDAAVAGAADSFDSLDGTWDHKNTSDQWDGTGPGEGNPGGVVSLIEDGVTFLRIQDIGDPRSLGASDPSNRKIFFGHLTDTDLDGVRLEFRARVATTPPLDGLDPDTPWPEGGIGFHIRDGGKGMIGIAEEGVGIISFSLAKAGEPGFEDLTTDVLVMNNLVGSVPSTDVDTEDTADTIVARNMIAVDDVTQWNTFVIDIAAGGSGTHIVSVSINGGPAETFEVTVGTGLQENDHYLDDCITMGSSGTGGVTAFDVDYITVSNY